MQEFLKDVLSGAAGDALLWALGLCSIAILGLLLRFRSVQRVRDWGSRTFNVPRIEPVLRYGISLNNWIPWTDVVVEPPARDTLVWALEQGGGPYSSTGYSYERITLNAAKPVSFEVLEVAVDYVREPHEQGTAYFAERDGLGGAGMIEPAYFRVHVGADARLENRGIRAERISAPGWAADTSKVTETYQISDARQLHIDLYLRALTEGLYTYTVQVRTLVNGIERRFTFDRAKYGERSYPLRIAYVSDPEMIHENFIGYGPETRWLPGPQPPDSTYESEA